METRPLFYQLFEAESSTYTYLIADPLTKEAALIDSVLETVERDVKLIQELDLQLKYLLDTHIHADHITGADILRQRTGAKSAVSARSGLKCADLLLEDGEEIFLGKLPIKALETPGHTNSCMSFVFDNKVFTGDALMIRGTGRTDFQEGCPKRLYSSIHEKLFKLPADTQIYPAHDYKGQTASTIGLEMKYNPRVAITKTQEEFVEIMANLKLPPPKKLNEAVPANLQGGRV